MYNSIRYKIILGKKISKIVIATIRPITTLYFVFPSFIRSTNVDRGGTRLHHETNEQQEEEYLTNV